MSIISYAQNFEDVMLWRALKDVKNGFYIDIGANDPIEHSVTKSMYDLGWSGINCEPVSHWFTKLKKNRVRDINLQVAIGANNAELEFFEVVDTGLSTLDKKTAEEHSRKYGFELKSYFVPVENLTAICEKEQVGTIHFLKVDVEGAEKSVLEGIDFEKIRPWIILVEATKPMSQEVDYDGWEYLLTSKNYHFVYFDGLNRFYVSDEHNELDCHFNKPPNVFDGFILSSQVKAEAEVNETEARFSEAVAEAHEWWTKATAAEVRAIEAEEKTHEWWTKATASEERAIEAEEKTHEWWTKATAAEERSNAIINSNSWKLMRPFRLLSQSCHKIILGCKAWLTFAPNSRPQRVLKTLLIVLKHHILTNPKLLKISTSILRRFPAVKGKLKKIILQDIITSPADINELSIRGNEVYLKLKSKSYIKNKVQ